MLTVTAAVLTDKDSIFIARRPGSDGHGFGGFWEFPGGKLEPGETLEECLIREIREELTVDIDVGPLLLDWTYDYPSFGVHLHAFRASVRSGLIVLRSHDSARWISPARLSDYTCLPADELLVAHLMKGIGPLPE